MLNKDTIEEFKKEWYSFEEINRIQESLKHYEETGEVYDIDEAFAIVEKEVFSKYKVNV